MRAAHSRFGPSGQCASLAGSRGLFREKGLQGSFAAAPRGDWCVQQVAWEEDRAFSRDLLKREDTSPERATESRSGPRKAALTSEPGKGSVFTVRLPGG